MLLAVSYNQPKFCPNASWNPNATTLANINLSSSDPYDIFVSTNNTVYVTNGGISNNRILVWLEGSINVTRTITSGLSYTYGLFVTTTGGIYVNYGSTNGRVDKWTLNTSTSIPAMYVCQACYDIFVDISDTLYCSMSSLHQVVTKSLNSSSSAFRIVAGTGSSGSASNTLSNPNGIFVNVNFDLYVADYNNHRIQLFQLGQSIATTVAGSAASGTITLNYPTGVVLDGNNYLFIVDSNKHRIVASGPNGFRCLVGCSGIGLAPDQLYNPQTMAFDSYGNIFVVDVNNNRIQKFVLSTNSCSKY